MVKRINTSETNDKINNFDIKRSFFIFKKLLFLIGRPFYVLLSSTLIIVLFIFYITGYSIRVFFLYFAKAFVKLYVLVKAILLRESKKDKKLKKKLSGTFAKIPISGYRKVTKVKLLILGQYLRLIRLFKLSAKEKIKIQRHSTLIKYTLFFLVFVTLFSPTLFYFVIVRGLPSPDELTTRNIEISTKIYDRNGILLYNIYKDKNRSVVRIEDVPDVVKYATLAAEDAEFYSHPGFSIRGISRAIIKNIREGKSSGGSTITQQLVKNALLTPEKTLIRKIKELYLSLNVERVYSKDEILEMYLNEVSYGGTAYGIQEAARTYFDKDIDKLTLAESALLAGLPKSPTKFSPHGSDSDAAKNRQKEILHLMKINGYINADQEEKALMETVKFTSNRTDIKAPHFVMYVREYLEDLYGKELVEQGGLTVKTTLDYQIQMLAEKVVADEITRLTPLNVTNASVVVVDPVTGEILAMVGSKDYFDIENDGNVNVALRERQSGSSIKVVNYAYALSHGYSPLTMIDDSPITFNFPGSEPYSPKNYDGTYSGKITLRNALAQSRNIPAVKVLASYGVDKMIELGKDMGITTWNEPTRYGLSITLGGAETKLIDLATVYSTLANYGVKPELTPLASVTDHKGNTYYTNSCKKEETTTKIQYALDLVSNIANADENKVAINTINHNCLGTQVLDSRVAYMLTDILKDNYARAPQFGLLSSLVIYNHPEVAVKTGTSNNLKDNLTIGYNQDYVVAVWVGNNDGSQMARVASGVTGASPIWNKIMTQLLAFSKSKDWEIPQGMAKIFICPTTGTLSCTGCANREEWFFAENVPTSRCSAEQIQALNTQE